MPSLDQAGTPHKDKGDITALSLLFPDGKVLFS